MLIELRIIPYERIIAIDEIGDIYHPGPHLLVEYSSEGIPFKPNAKYIFLEPFSSNINIGKDMNIKEGRQISYFPSELTNYPTASNL